MLCDENVLSLSEAAAGLPRLNGRKPHTSTIWRWVTKGVGGVRLEARRLGGRYCTSVEALDRFGLALAEVDPPGRPHPLPRAPTDRQRQRTIEQAERTLQGAGIL